MPVGGALARAWGAEALLTRLVSFRSSYQVRSLGSRVERRAGLRPTRTTSSWEDQGSHRTLYRFSEIDFNNLASVWKGVHPDDGEEVGVEQGPPAGGEQADFPESPEHFAPGYDPGELAEIAKRMDGE